MSLIRTHYDNLQVAREAPPEVIRAAYRALAQKFHPDKNPGNVEASNTMSIINASFDVLSDPAKRLAHDRWIADQERSASQAEPRINRPTQTKQPVNPTSTPISSDFSKIISHISRHWVWYGITLLVIWVTVSIDPESPPPGPKPYQITAPVEPLPKPTYVRPNTAPNGEPWPIAAAYVNQYPRLHTNGLSSVTIDNSQNDSDVFVKLVSLSGQQAFPVRTIFIPGRGIFKINRIRAGSYDIRYKDLSSGGLSRSESFTLEETSTEGGIRYSNSTMTLYKVPHGNMQTYGLSESEF